MNAARRLVVFAALPILLHLAASQAFAHVRLVSSAPASGDVLTVAPTTIRLVFSERVQLALTSVTLVDARGDTIPIGSVRFDRAGELEVIADVLQPLSAGEYVIWWRTVSADGHPVTDRIPFILELPEPALPAEPGVAADPPPSPPIIADPDPESTGFHVRSPLFVFFRWVSYLSLLGMFGSAVFIAVILPAVSRRAPDWRGPDLEAAWRARRWGVLASIGFLLAAVARLVAQGTALVGPLDVNIDVLNALVLESPWGRTWIVQVASGFLMAGFLAGGERRWARVGALLMVPVLATATGAAGHALVTPWPAAVVAAHAGHLVGIGVWFGVLAMLLLAALPAARAMESAVASRMTALVNLFSPVALGCGGLVVLTGLAAAAAHVGSLSALWESDYGRVLILKVLVFAVVLGLGAWNWRRMRPLLAGSGDAAPLRTTGGLELAFATLVLVVSSLLVATPPPG